MDWTEIKDVLTSASSFELTISGRMGASKTLTFTMTDRLGAPGPLTFTTLGTGSMKRVVRVVGEEWVLALAGDSPGAKTDIDGEVKTLIELHGGRVRVPKPFDSSTLTEIVFPLTVVNTDSGDEKAYPAFLQQFLSSPTWVEMAKLDKKEDFAKNKIVEGGRVPTTIDTTLADLRAILNFFNTVREWGDFQVMYNTLNGQVVVFDPLPTNEARLDFKGLVKHWIDDIEAAVRFRKTASLPTRPRSLSVGSSPRGGPITGGH